MLKRIFEYVMDFLYDIAAVALALLPTSPFADIGTSFAGFETIMSYINYFVPIGPMLAIFTTYLTAVLVWYGIRWILRIAKYID